MSTLSPVFGDLLTIRHADSPPAWVAQTLACLREQGWRLTYADVSRDTDHRPVLWFHAHEPPATFPNVYRVMFDGFALPNPWAALDAAASGRGDARLSIARRVHGTWHDVAGMQAFVDGHRPDRGLGFGLPKVHHLIDRALRTAKLGPPVASRAPRNHSRRAAQRARVVARWARQKAKRRNTVDQWQIGYRFGGELADPGGFHWVEPPKDRFWADPFALTWNDQHIVFFEEFCYPFGPGTLHAARVSKSGGFQLLGAILDTGSHLSFPNIFKHDGELYMVPESVATGHVQLYRCAEFPHKWELCAVLAERRIVDTVIVQHAGQFWLIGSEETHGGSSSNDNLVAMTATQLTGPYTPVDTPLVLDVRNARNAGAWQTNGDRWIRPSQDCSGRYGRAIHLHHVEQLDENGLVERAIATIEPLPGELGRHTLNRDGELIVTDRQVRVRAG